MLVLPVMNPTEPKQFQAEPETSDPPMSNLERWRKPREYPDRRISDIKDMRCVFLMLLIREMRAAGNECFGLSIEHAVFVLMQLDDPGLGYEFNLRLLGPESERLEMDMGAMIDAGWATLGDCLDGQSLRVTEEGRSFLIECPVTVEKCRKSVEETVRIAGRKSNYDLMMLATAMYLIQSDEGKGKSPTELVEFYLRIRRTYDRSEVRERVDEALALLSKESVKEPVPA